MSSTRPCASSPTTTDRLGLGGVIGGEASGSTEATKNVLIESALFDPLRTAATGRKTGLATDARYRFERGVDPDFVLPGLDLATQMILKLCGGKPSKTTVAGKVPDARRSISFDSGQVAKLAGLDLPAAEIRTILESLGCEILGKGAVFTVTTPSWRPDLHGPADLVEEVVRIAGIDRIPATPMPRADGVARPVLTERQKRSRKARRTLAGRGLVEAITWSFIPRAAAKAFGGGADALELANPISSEMSSMRPSLLPGLLDCGQAQPQPRLCRCRAVRAGAGLSRRGAGGSVRRRRRHPRRNRQASGQRPSLGRHCRRGRRVRCQGRRRRRTGGARLRSREGADHARRTRLVPSGPLGRAPARAEGRARALRRAASRDAEGAGRRGARRRLRDLSRRRAGAESQEPRQAAARCCRSPARAPRLRLRARCLRRGGRRGRAPLSPPTRH